MIIHVLADLLECALDALQIIVSHSPAAAVLGIILTVDKDCPPIFYLAFIVLEAVVVNAEAAALGGIVVHGILRFADAADGLFYFSLHSSSVLWQGGLGSPCLVKHVDYLLFSCLVLRRRATFLD